MYYIWAVKTITVRLPDEMDSALEAVSEQRRVSKSVILREALEKTLAREVSQTTLYSLMKDRLGCIDSGIPDLATNPDHLEGYGQ